MSRNTAVRKPQVRSGLEVEIVERKDAPGTWSVEAIEQAGDGACYSAVFYGPDSQVRAKEYARMKYDVQ